MKKIAGFYDVTRIDPSVAKKLNKQGWIPVQGSPNHVVMEATPTKKS